MPLLRDFPLMLLSHGHCKSFVWSTAGCQCISEEKIWKQESPVRSWTHVQTDVRHTWLDFECDEHVMSSMSFASALSLDRYCVSWSDGVQQSGAAKALKPYETNATFFVVQELPGTAKKATACKLNIFQRWLPRYAYIYINHHKSYSFQSKKRG